MDMTNGRRTSRRAGSPLPAVLVFRYYRFFRADVGGGVPDAPRADASIGPYKWSFTANKKAEPKLCLLLFS